MSGRQRDVARAVAARERGRSRLRSVTATIGLASLAAGGALAYELPRATHTKTTGVSSAGKSTSSSAAAASGGSASTGSTSTSGTSSASTGLSSSGAPASSSGTSQVTSGGS
jgi:hypothetical protein